MNKFSDSVKETPINIEGKAIPDGQAFRGTIKTLLPSEHVWLKLNGWQGHRVLFLLQGEQTFINRYSDGMNFTVENYVPVDLEIKVSTS